MNGTDGDDILIGSLGVDELVGGLGDDRYYVLQHADVDVIEAIDGGYDRVRTTFNYTLAAGQGIEVLRAHPNAAGVTFVGNELDNSLIGAAGDDTLFGGLGNDRLAGGLGADILAGEAGNDVYYVNDGSDQVIEAVGGGYDVVYASADFTLAAGEEVEVLRAHPNAAAALRLTGNEFDNVLIGGAGDDFLDGGTGSDRISGGGGGDTITTSGASARIFAGDGDDTIRVDGSSASTGLVRGGDGVDTVRSADLGQFEFRNVEILDTYYGFVNATARQIAAFETYAADLAAADAQISISLRGTGGTLDFTTGIGGLHSVEIRDVGLTSRIVVTGSINDDSLIGSLFNDTLRGGNGSDALSGGDGRDTLEGGASDDRLNGGADNDRLTGGAGDDTFVFDAPIGGGINIDRIMDFTSDSDRIEIDQEYYFPGLSIGQLVPIQFAQGVATGTAPQLVYLQSEGALYFDSNGADDGGDTLFALLAGNPVLVSSDFWIV